MYMFSAFLCSYTDWSAKSDTLSRSLDLGVSSGVEGTSASSVSLSGSLNVLFGATELVAVVTGTAEFEGSDIVSADLELAGGVFYFFFPDVFFRAACVFPGVDFLGARTVQDVVVVSAVGTAVHLAGRLVFPLLLLFHPDTAVTSFWASHSLELMLLLCRMYLCLELEPPLVSSWYCEYEIGPITSFEQSESLESKERSSWSLSICLGCRSLLLITHVRVGQ